MTVKETEGTVTPDSYWAGGTFVGFTKLGLERNAARWMGAHKMWDLNALELSLKLSQPFSGSTATFFKEQAENQR